MNSSDGGSANRRATGSIRAIWTLVTARNTSITDSTIASGTTAAPYRYRVSNDLTDSGRMPSDNDPGMSPLGQSPSLPTTNETTSKPFAMLASAGMRSMT